MALLRTPCIACRLSVAFLLFLKLCSMNTMRSSVQALVFPKSGNNLSRKAFRRQRYTGSSSLNPCLFMASSSSSSSSSKASYSSTISPMTPVPRAAVSSVIRYCPQTSSSIDSSVLPQYLLIERGNPPNKGVWCVPGGKIELGEPTLAAAQRELAEEVKFDDNNNGNDNNGDNKIQLAWYPGGAFCTSDSIVKGDTATGKEGYHYLIAQCFAEVIIVDAKDDNNTANDSLLAPPPPVTPADDAQAAKWWTLEDIRTAEANKETVPNLVRVIERAETLYQCKMLPTTIISSST